LKKANEKFTASTGRWIDPNKPSIALTFDDGPNMTNSVTVLNALEERGIVATYFVIALNINDETAELMKRGYSLGCEYAPHAFDWSYGTAWSKEEYVKNIRLAADKITGVLGEGARSAFHRIHGGGNSETGKAIKELGYPNIGGIWAKDWEPTPPAKIYELIVPNVKDGTIIGLHDGNSNNNTAIAIGDILDALIEKGYQFLTLTELFELRGVTVEPGRNYNRLK
jgi:peptidoglycan/xylan/chitin deacetylase (PgdA/CDA1 family)